MAKKVLLVLIIFSFTVAGVILFANFERIDMIYTAYFMSEDVLKAKRTASEKKLLTTLADEYGIENLNEVMKQSEEDDIAKGIISIDEIKQRLEKQRQKRVAQAAKDQKQVSCRIAVEDAIEEMYLLKATYLTKLSGIEKEIISYYNSLMRQEGMTKSKAKLSVAENYTETMLRFQKECDDKVATVLSKLESVLKDNDGDTTVVSQIRTEYQNMKNEKLNYYMSRYNKK